jgi:hypothetical protein
MQKLVLLALCLLFLTPFTPSAQALEKTNRLGIGMTNQLKNEFPALSFKIQKSKTFALGGMLGLSTSDKEGGYGAGVKFYRNIFDEPQLNFYVSGMLGLLSNKINGTGQSGFQVDLSLGSEFHLSGLNSIGFSFEFGVSANKKKDFVFETIGNNFVVAGIHFYL